MKYQKLAEMVIKKLQGTITNPDLSKAVEGDIRQIFDNIELVGDVWNQGGEGWHGLPSREEIKFGPEEAASGGGASKMVREYSRFATQQGLAEAYDRMSRDLDKMKKAFAEMSTQIKSHSDILTTVVDTFIKSEKKEDKEEKKEEKEEMEKAKSYQKKARTSILKAEDEDEEKEDRKEEVEKAKSHLKKAKDILLKAHEDAKDDKEEEEVEKSLSEVKKLSKRVSEIESSLKKAEEEEKEKREKEEKEKVEKAEKEKKEKEEADKSKNQDEFATSKAAIEEIAKKSIFEVFDTLMSQSKGGSVPDLRKADLKPVLEKKAEELEYKYESGEISSSDFMFAKSLLLKADMALKGELDFGVVKNLMIQAPTSVREIFKPIAA